MDPRPLTVTLEPEATQPAHCAGLREALQYRWRRGFPLQDAPFMVLGRELGATPREVIGHCQLLREKGALDAIRVQWGTALHRVRWRCGLVQAGPPQPPLAAALRALPGVTGWDWTAPDRHTREHVDEPTLWFDIVARDAASAEAQRRQLEACVGPFVCLALDEAGPACRCDEGAGPCASPLLARRCEAGLPLVAHPYGELAEAVSGSERAVLGTLRRWQRNGQLRSIGLSGPPPACETVWSTAAVAGPALPSAARDFLLARPGIAEVDVLPGHARWPYRLLVTTSGASGQAGSLLLCALAAAGLAQRPRRLMRVHRVRVRAAPLLFAAAA
jgi:hypothetical protein